MRDRNPKYCHRHKTALCFTGLVLLLGAVAGGLAGCASDGGKEPAWEKNVIREEIALDGVTGEYDFLFLTDSHVVIPDESASEQEKTYSQERYALFQNEQGVPAEQMFRGWIDYANREKVDAVFLGGDIIDSPSDANMEYLGKELERLETPYLYTLGNHDWTFPWEYMSDAGKETYLPLFEDYMGGDTAVHMWETDELRVIALDNSSNQANPAALDAYEKMLATDKKVILLLHVPFSTPDILAKGKEIWGAPVSMGFEEGDVYPNEDTMRLLRLTLAADSPVELILAGHVHFYDRQDISWEKTVPQIVGDAAFHGSAVRLHVTGKSDTNVNSN